jgi:hypothetical protein
VVEVNRVASVADRGIVAEDCPLRIEGVKRKDGSSIANWVLLSNIRRFFDDPRLFSANGQETRFWIRGYKGAPAPSHFIDEINEVPSTSRRS